jgi:hypothetical protein
MFCNRLNFQYHVSYFPIPIVRKYGSEGRGLVRDEFMSAFRQGRSTWASTLRVDRQQPLFHQKWVVNSISWSLVLPL